MAKQDANWVEIDPETLDDTTREAYQAYKAAYRAMKDAREFFESIMQAGLVAPGKRLVFGYNFGKLSIAIVDDDRKPTKAKQAKLSLADFLAQAQSNGQRY